MKHTKFASHFVTAAAATMLSTGAWAAALPGIQIDPTGLGNILGSTPFATAPVSQNSGMLVGCAPPSTGVLATSCTLIAQSFGQITFKNGDLGTVVWQLDLDVEVTGLDNNTSGTTGDALGETILLRNPTLGAAGITPTAGVSGSWVAFLDTTGVFGGVDANLNRQDGLGYGDLNATVPKAGLVELMRGDAQLTLNSGGAPLGNTGSMTVNGPGLTPLATTATNNTGTSGGGGQDYTAVDTIRSTGSLTVDIDITSQTGFVANDMVNADLLLDIDVLLNGISTTTPFTTNSVIAQSVVGDVPGFGGTGDNNWVDGDFLFQIVGEIQFNGQLVPEPATLALTGMGLGLIGFFGNRRRRRVTPA